MHCTKRIKELQGEEAKEREVEDGWVTTDNPAGAQAKQETVDIDDEAYNDVKQEQEEEAFDIDDDLDNNNVFASAQFKKQADPENALVKTRTYDLSITYDFYYQTPRLWLLGYSETGQPLSEAQTFEDIMADYAKKTVTMEPHVHTGIKQASIHPCNHGKVMKKIIDTIQGNGGKPMVHQSLFFFLKFISSVVPTIEYDFTIDLELE